MENSQVAHVWAQQMKLGAKGSHFYFEGPTIYSYGPHFPIARFCTVREYRCVLFTTRDYSNTTKKHKSLVRGALAGLGVMVLYVADPTLQPTIADAEYLKAQVKVNLEKMSAARSWKDVYLTRARRMEEQFFLLCKTFQLNHPDANAAQLIQLDAAALKALGDGRRKNRQKLKREREERLKDKELHRSRWIKQEQNHLIPEFSSPVLLRLSPDGKIIETSRGAEVPVKDALKAFRLFKKGGEITGVRIGEFTVSGMIGEDIIAIGCHQIPITECERVLSSLA